MERIDLMDPEGVAEIQQTLADLGFYKGEVDGVWAYQTAWAYAEYWRHRNGAQINVPIVAPAPAEPWWESRAMQGALVTVVVSIAGVLGYVLDSGEVAALILALSTLVSGIWSAYGTKNRRNPIDQTLVARLSGNDLRIPS
jgi:peptidoglycan hydrolase-like protein with peptidoglycan-binding domain